MINISFNEINPEQALALLTTYTRAGGTTDKVTYVETQAYSVPVPAAPVPGPASVAAPTQPVLPFVQQPATAPNIPAAMPAAPTPAPASTPVPTAAAPTYTLEQLSVAAAPLLDAGRVKDLQDLIRRFGCSSLTELPAERYGEYATALRLMGARI